MPAKRFAKLHRVCTRAFLIVLSTICFCRDSSLAADIHVAVRTGNAQEVIAILEKHPELVDVRNNFGETPLYRAVLEEKTEIVMVLLKHGADPDLRVSEGETPLHMAVYDGQLDTVMTLLKHGADPNLQDINGWTPLFYSCKCLTLGPWEEIASKLLEHGADISIGDVYDRTVLHIIAYAPPRFYQMAKNIGRFLIENGAEVNKQDHCGNTPLHNAAATGLIPVIELLLDEGADPSIWNRQGQTPLRHLFTSDMLEEPIVKVVDIFGDKMDTDKIFEAARLGETGMLRDMLSSDMELVFRKDRAGWTLLHWAVWGNSPNAVQILLDSGASPNAMCAGLLRPIDLAACRGATEVARILIERDAQYYGPFSDGWTPLHFAAHWGQKEVATVFIEHGADVYIRNNMCSTPLCQAVHMQRVEVAKVLIGAGADVYSEDGTTALHRAVKRENKDAIRVLLGAGADVKKERADGRTPLDLALETGNEEIIELLRKAKD